MKNEGHMAVEMVSSLEGTQTKLCAQVSKVTRPLLSVTQITEEGQLEVLCRRYKAVVVDIGGKVIAAFDKRNGLYVYMDEIRSPKEGVCPP